MRSRRIRGVILGVEEDEASPESRRRKPFSFPSFAIALRLRFYRCRPSLLSPSPSASTVAVAHVRCLHISLLQGHLSRSQKLFASAISPQPRPLPRPRLTLVVALPSLSPRHRLALASREKKVEARLIDHPYICNMLTVWRVALASLDTDNVNFSSSLTFVHHHVLLRWLKIKDKLVNLLQIRGKLTISYLLKL